MAEPEKGAVSAQAMQRWENYIKILEDSIRLMLSNKLAEADKVLEEASAEVAEREIDFAGGEHDPRGCFALVGAIMSLINGMASLENNQLEEVLARVWAADALLANDNDWAGRTVLRGLSLLIAGIVEIMQGSLPRGVWHVLRSWLFLRYLESEGLNCQGHERSTVRSTSLLSLGVFNLFKSLLPPSAMKTAGWVTGFSGDRNTAMSQLQACWEEGGIVAPFAALVLTGIAVDVSHFLGELKAQRAERHKEARKVLDWSAEKFPGAFFFEGLEASFSAVNQDLEGAVKRLEDLEKQVEGLPAFLFLVHVRIATFRASMFEWEEASRQFHNAVQVYRKVGRRAMCPTLALNAHLCFSLAGQPERAAEMLELSRSYRSEEKKWGHLDKQSLKQAALASAVARGETPEEPWHPELMMYLKVGVIYRAVNFMKPDLVEKFLAAVREKTVACGDIDGRCLGLMIEAEALRQCEAWDEALAVTAKVATLGPSLSARGKKSGVLQFCQLVAAYAYHAQGKVPAAKDALNKLEALGGGHFFQKQVDFKATHLRQLLGAEFKDTYASLSVVARSKARVVVEVPEVVESVEWDWILQDYSITFTAVFTPTGGEPKELQKVEQHQADSGPFMGSLEQPAAGRLELTFDNSFSRLRAKSLQYRLQPAGLEAKREDA